MAASVREQIRTNMFKGGCAWEEPLQDHDGRAVIVNHVVKAKEWKLYFSTISLQQQFNFHFINDGNSYYDRRSHDGSAIRTSSIQLGASAPQRFAYFQ